MGGTAGRRLWWDTVARAVTLGFAGSVLGMLGAILVFLLVDSWPSVVYSGLQFFTGTVWNLGNLYGGVVHRDGVTAAAGAQFGVLVFVVGTLATSLIAVVLALPVSVGVALYLAEEASPGVGTGVSFFVELLAGVPSVVYGLWGLTVLVPWIGNSLGPFLVRHLGFLPWFRGPVHSGMGMLASGLVLAVMILPIIAATTRDVLLQVPRSLKDGALALGLTRWEMIRAVSLPFARTGIIGATILGLGRALGETMAVLMVSGNAVNILPSSVFSPISTMASTLVSQLDSAMTDATGMALHALAEMALVLFLITVLVNVVARMLVREIRVGPMRAMGE